jgi:hypothetical protein
MDTSALTPNQIAAIVAVVALLAIALVVMLALHRRRTQRLRAQFGPEYDRTLAEFGNKRFKAEARLAERSERVRNLSIRPLTAAEHDRYAEEWTRVQAHFVDTPAGAVSEADQLLGDVMATCGYPIGDFEQRAADISVDHPFVAQNYRAAHSISLRQVSGQASTEELRRAMIHYRALFEELLGMLQAPDSRPVVVEERTLRTEFDPRRRAS